MAGIKISALTAASSIGLTDTFVIVQGGTTKKVLANVPWNIGGNMVVGGNLTANANLTVSGGWGVIGGTALTVSGAVLQSRGTVAKATTASEICAFFGSSDSSAPLGLRVDVGNHATAGSRTVSVTAVEPGVATRTLNLNSALVFVDAGANLTANGTIVTVGSLAGAGSRAVLADANGILSAPVSDERLKEKMRPLPEKYGVQAVMALKPSIFKFKDKLKYGKQDYLGFGARHTAKVIPPITGVTNDGVFYINEEKWAAPLVLALQQQEKRLRRLERK